MALSAIGVGSTLCVVSAVALGAALVPLATGAIGVALGAGYLLSPSWKLEVVVDADALTVRTPKKTRFRLPWGNVKRVVASPTTHTCFVDGGSPDQSLLVPGDGAPAPYDIENKPELFAAILAAVAAEKVETVETLEAKRASS
jgi:hypothetical protein